MSKRETYAAFGFKRVCVNTFRVTEVHVVVERRTTSNHRQAQRRRRNDSNESIKIYSHIIQHLSQFSDMTVMRKHA